MRNHVSGSPRSKLILHSPAGGRLEELLQHDVKRTTPNEADLSLCDLRSVEDGKLQHALDAYDFLDYRKESRGPVFLFLTTSAIEDLVPYRALRDRINNLEKLIVPFIEAGSCGAIYRLTRLPRCWRWTW